MGEVYLTVIVGTLLLTLYLLYSLPAPEITPLVRIMTVLGCCVLGYWMLSAVQDSFELGRIDCGRRLHHTCKRDKDPFSFIVAQSSHVGVAVVAFSAAIHSLIKRSN